MATTTQYIERISPPLADSASSAARKPRRFRMNTLVLSRDENAVRSFYPVLASAGSAAQLCTEPELAMEMLARSRFDAMVIDYDGVPRALEVLRCLRKSPSSYTAVAFVLVDRTPASFAFANGATFVLNKPVTRDQVQRILRAAQGVMILGSRRYYRRPLVTAATFVTSARESLQLWTVNISEGGLRVEGPRVPAKGERGTITLQLPQTEGPIISGVETVWSSEEEAGLRFTNIVDGGRAILRDWIRKSFEQELAAMKPASQDC